MRIVKKLLMGFIVILLLIPVSIELFYQYRVYILQPKKVLSKVKYSSLFHDVLWVSFKEKGDKRLEKFTATGFVYRQIKYTVSSRAIPRLTGRYNVSPKGVSIINQVARNQLMNRSNVGASWHLNNAVFAIWVSNNYKEYEAFDYVLDSMFYGHNLYGLSDASEYYYGKNIKNLNLSEVVSLLAIPEGPSRFDPYRNIKKHEERARLITQRLKEVWPSKYQNFNYGFPLFVNQN